MFRWVGRMALSTLGGAVLVGTAMWAVNDARQVARIRQLEFEKAELQRIVARLKTERRVARLFVADQTRDDQGSVTTKVEFREFDPNGGVLPVRTFEVLGDAVYVDALVVRFSDEYVERGDALRGHSLHLFRRIFGEQQRPSDGSPIDPPNQPPAAYQTDSKPSEFQKQLWKRFWQYASDPREAAKAGVRVAQGEAVYQQVRSGQLWDLATRADGGLEFRLSAVDPMIEAHLSAPGKAGRGESLPNQPAGNRSAGDTAAESARD